MRAFLALSASLACLVAIVVACGDPSHVYEGRFYREDKDCLGTASALDVVLGEKPGNCEPKCFVQTDPAGRKDYHVATMCPPYPVEFDGTGRDPICTKALAAFARNDECFPDGGTSNPAPKDAAAE